MQWGQGVIVAEQRREEKRSQPQQALRAPVLRGEHMAGRDSRDPTAYLFFTKLMASSTDSAASTGRMGPKICAGKQRGQSGQLPNATALRALPFLIEPAHAKVFSGVQRATVEQSLSIQVDKHPPPRA